MKPAHIAALPHNERRLTSAAMILARTRHGLAAEAAGFAEAEAGWQPERDANLPATTLALFSANVSEAYATVGFARHGTHAARRTHEYAVEAGSDPLLYRAYGLLAGNRALAGEFVLAEEAIDHATALEEAHGWQQSPAAYMLLVGQVLLASARMDSVALARHARDLRETLPGEPTWQAHAALADAVRYGLLGRHSDGIAALVSVTHGADQHVVAPLIRNMILSYHSTLLIGRGEPQRALTLLEGRESSVEHTLCFDLQRASAHLQLGDDRKVLTTTDGCIRLGPRHNLRTLTPILLRRALANERLGHHTAADISFSDAFHLLHRSGAATPLLTLPRAEIDVLLDRLHANRPDLHGTIDELRQRVLTVPSTAPPSFVPPLLTEREVLIARRLREGATLSEIATALYVTRNTVKTHTASLYRKLGACSRDEAIALLERTGFYDNHT